MISVMIRGHMALIRIHKRIDLIGRAVHPTRRGKLGRLKAHGQAVFKLDPAGQNLKLERSHNADDSA